jgi:hypothetical protein
VQLNWRPRNRRFDERLMMSLIASNTLAGVDRLLHGRNLRGWGQPILADRNLLTVTGFNPNTREYAYTINQRFGTPRGANNPFGVPFQLGIRGQITLGTDAQRAQMRALTANGKNDSTSRATIKQSVLRQVPYPLDSLLKQADSLELALTAEQRATITAAGTKYRVFINARGEELATLLSANGGRPDMGVVGPKLQTVNVGIVRELQASIKLLEATLTPAQWAKVPEKVKFPLGQQPGGV